MTEEVNPVDTYEDRLAAVEVEWRAKYNAEELKDAAAKGHAMDGGSYPVKDQDDLEKAIKAVGRGNADHDSIRAHIIKNATRLKLAKLIPDNWNADGSLAEEQKSDDAEVEERTPDTARPRRKERRRAVPLMPEVRHWQAEGLEVRSSKTTDEIIITGTPIVYNAPYTVTDMFGEFTERMLPGVASEVLERGADVRFLFNHDGLPLARTTAGTLTLEDSPTALRMVATLDARQQLANDLAIATERGDVSQMSIGFMTARDEWDEAMEERDVILFSDLLDVSSVTYPASPTTATQVAQRMLMMAPIESRARLRNFLVAERAGKTLSGTNSGKVVSAIEALHSLYEAGGGNPADLIAEDESTETAPDGTRSEDGEPIRSSASVLRLQLEARSKKRKRLKTAA